jgi:hypothetical protein
MLDAETVFFNRWLSFRGYFWLTGDVKQFRNYRGLTKIARCGFSWRKTTKRSIASPISCIAALVERSDVRLSSLEGRMQFGGSKKIHRKSGFGLHQLRNCFGGQDTQCAKRSSQELLCPRKFHPILSRNDGD